MYYYYCCILILINTISVVVPIFSSRPNKIFNWSTTNKCSNNSEENMTVIELIKHSGFTNAEEHFVESPDGYIIGLQRIPGPKGSRAVLLHHGFSESSFSWIANGKNKALAYQLARNGYDVWLANARGNTYSRRHVRLSPRNSDFWNFSWHEMGAYDLAEEINYITKIKNNDSIVYIGHSMGTTIFFVAANEKPEILQKVNMMIGLGPAAYLDHAKGLLLNFKPALEALQSTNQDHMMEILEPNEFFKYMGKCVCNRPLFREVCRDFLFSICGFNPDKFDMSLLPMIQTHMPAGTSLKTLYHFFQMHKSKKFAKYDYGETINFKVYGKSSPPEYNISKINVPIALFYGLNDFLTVPKDVIRLYKQLPNKIGLFQMEDPNFTHVDFIWGTHAPELVNSKIMLLLQKYHFV